MTLSAAVRKIHIGSVIRNAVVFNFKNGGAMNADSLPGTVARLFSLLHEREIDYVLVGGIAMLQYIEGRNTEDIDLIVALPSLKKLPEIEIASQDADFARGKFEELQIDLLLTHDPLFEKVRRKYSQTRGFVEQDIPCATVEGLILLKLYALPSLYRQGNFARVNLYESDIAALVYDYHPAMEPLFDELAQHLKDSDLRAVRDVVADIQKRVERFGRKSS